jgi:hypothetical protein
MASPAANTGKWARALEPRGNWEAQECSPPMSSNRKPPCPLPREGAKLEEHAPHLDAHERDHRPQLSNGRASLARQCEQQLRLPLGAGTACLACPDPPPLDVGDHWPWEFDAVEREIQVVGAQFTSNHLKAALFHLK